jgi:two-component system NtrC family response regulator
MEKPKILVVEDEELMRSILRKLLEREGFYVATADSAETAVELFTASDFDLTLTDVRMGGKDGLQLLDELKLLDPEALVTIMTAYSSIDTAVSALRKGAYDYIIKPFVNEDLLQSVRNAIRQRQLFSENRSLRRELQKQHSFSEIIGNSSAIQAVFRLIEKVASTNAGILIQGESGTGKELVARAIHNRSQRADGPFVALNCGALPESLLESELFGHTKGSFTGAFSDKKGLFKSADSGTLFLDEIGELPFPLQVKLLRAIQEHEITPVGSTTPVKFDARIIAATNRNLELEVSNGNFREDLFYRLNVIEVFLPPLRERREDIPLLAKHFADRAASEHQGTAKQITKEAMFALVNYNWQGNIRELQNAVERALILSDEKIDLESLPPKIRNGAETGFDVRDPDGLRPTLDEIERRYILEVMKEVNQDKARAANILGVDLSTLYRKLKRFGDL